jgi:Fur family ferric uptake transcriptional regulator
MTLQKAELLHRIQGTDGIWRFSAHAAGAKHKCGGDHVHFLCSGCNKMSCLPEQPLPWISPPSGAKIHGKQLLVYGRCPACAAKEKR